VKPLVVLPKRVTASWLRKQRACKAQVDLFRTVFPRGADVTQENLDVTQENLRIARQAGLNLAWLVEQNRYLYVILRSAWHSIPSDQSFDVLVEKAFSHLIGYGVIRLEDERRPRRTSRPNRRRSQRGA
jgi:hypothetical protein